MKHLKNREDYIKEYLRISNSIDNINSNNIDNKNELYEGLLSTVFGGLKMLLKKDWVNIKCKNPSVLEHLKAIDKSLSGYTMTKMKFSSECQNIRQNIADYFNDILDYKLLQIEKEDNVDKFIENTEKEEKTETNGVAKILNLKDNALLDSLKKYKENIATQCKVDPKLREYADQMLNTVVVFVNDIVLTELEKKGADKAKIEEERKRIEEERKKLEEVRNKMNEEAKNAGEEKLKKLADERDKQLRKLGVTPIGAMAGDKAIESIAKQFVDMLKEFNDIKLNESVLPKGYAEILRSDTYLGIQKSLEELDWNFSENEEDSPKGLYDKFFIKVILNKINTVFNVINDNKSRNLFIDVPSASVQSMMVSLCNAIIYGFVGDKFNIEKNKARLGLLTKCAIDSDATIGFNLPLIDPKKPDNGNFFVSIMNQFKGDDISSQEVEDAAKSLSEEEIKKISQLLNNSRIEDSSENGSNENNESNENSQNENEEIVVDPQKISAMVMKDFRQNMTKLFDMIVKEAKKLKEAAEKNRKEESKAQHESKSTENI